MPRLLFPGAFNPIYVTADTYAVLHPSLMTRWEYNPIAIQHRIETAKGLGVPVIHPREYDEFMASVKGNISYVYVPDDDIIADMQRHHADVVPNQSFHVYKQPADFEYPRDTPKIPLPTLKSILAKTGMDYGPSTDKDNRHRIPPGEKVPKDAILFATTREEALSLMAEFFSRRFVNFGKYEDAIHPDDDLLYHSNISAALNIGLLFISDILEYDISEAFYRQVFGWREYMHAIWWYNPRDSAGNLLGTWAEFMSGALAPKYTDKRPLKKWGDVALSLPPIVANAITRARDVAYAHHIIRLMVISNYTYLTAVDPVDCVNLFIGLTVDAYPWVMYGNVIYMGRFIFGRVYTRKAYFSSSNYLRKMMTERLDPISTSVFDELYAVNVKSLVRAPTR